MQSIQAKKLAPLSMKIIKGSIVSTFANDVQAVLNKENQLKIEIPQDALLQMLNYTYKST